MERGEPARQRQQGQSDGPEIEAVFQSLDGQSGVEDIPLAVWGLCFGKVGGVISFLFGPVRGCPRMGPQCLLTPPVSASSIYAAGVYGSGGKGQFVISGVLLLSYPVSCVNLSMLSLILSSFFLSLLSLSRRT